MSRGTRVGSAYVAVTADGDGINESIVGAFDDVNFKDIGDKHGRAYRKQLSEHLAGFNKEIDELFERQGNRLTSRLSKAVDSDDAISTSVSKKLAQAFDDGRLDDLIFHAGKKAGVEFGSGFEKETTRGVLEALEETLQKAARKGNFDLSDVLFGANSADGRQVEILGATFDQMVKKTEQYVAERVKQEKLGEQIVAKMREDYAKDYGRLLDQRDRNNEARVRERVRQERLGERIVAKMREGYAKDYARLLDQRDRDNEARIRERIRQERLGEQIITAMNKQAEKDRLDAAESRVRTMAALRKAHAAAEKRATQEFTKDFMKSLDEITKGSKTSTDSIIRDAERRTDVSKRLLEELETAEEVARHNRVVALKKEADAQGRTNKQLDIFSDRMGKVTGKGSRNNFLNFVGSSVRNLFRLGQVVPIVSGKMAELGRTFSTAFQGAGGGLRGVIAGIGASGKGLFASLAKSGPTAIAAIAGLVVVLGTMTAALSLALGAVTALAGSLVFALGGALAGAAALLLPLVAGIGTAVIAVRGLDKAQKKMLANDFKPMIAQAKDLKEALADGFFDAFDSEAVSGNLTSGLKTIQPLLRSISASVADVAEKFARLGDSPAFNRFVGSMQRVLPSAIESIGNGLADFSAGFMGVFRALEPTIARVSDWFARIGEDFRKWANSTEGQNSLQNFFEGAIDSLSVVKDFLGQVTGLLADLFNKGGKDAGDRMFGSMADAIERFRNSLSERDIERWFKDAEEFAQDVGDAIVGIGRALDALDDPMTREFAKGFFNAIEVGAGLAIPIIKQVYQAVLGLGDGFLYIADIALQAFDLVNTGIGNLIGGALDALAIQFEALSKLPKIGGIFDGAADSLAETADSVRGKLGGAIDDTLGKVNKLRGGLRLMSKGVAPGDLKIIEKLRSAVESIPNKKVTQLVAEGGDISIRQMKKLIANYDLAPDEIRTLAKLLGDDEVKKNLDTLIGRADDFDASNPSPLVRVRDQASGPLAALFSAVDRLDGKSATVTTYMVTKRIVQGPSGSGGGGGYGAIDDYAPRSVVAPDTAGRSMVDTGVAAVAGPSAVPSVMSRGFAAPVLSAAPAVLASPAAVANRNRKGADKVAATFKSLMKDLAKSIAAGLKDARKAITAADARSGLSEAISGINERIAQRTQQRINNLPKAGKGGEKARKALIKQMNAQGKRAAKAASEPLREQRDLTGRFVKALLKGRKVENATLADYAAARGRLAKKIERANEELSAAIALRDDFRDSVISATRSFADLTTAQGQVIDGVEQGVTATDITSNLETRLAQIRKFQENLQILLAQGLSNSAYQQLVEAGVEGGGAYAQALVDGTGGTVGQVNGLVAQVDALADQLGLESSNRLYQAGVDAAQGLVNGLESMSDRLDKAATKLGNSIARAIKKSLGIKSPSRVMIEQMGYVGDGIAFGLDAQHAKVGSAASRLSSKIAVSPEVAAYAAAQGKVSGNAPGNDIDIHVTTPTHDPHAVAHEVMNQVVGALN